VTALLADISSGNTGFADVMFLVGLILFLLAAVLLYPRQPPPSVPAVGHTVAALGLAAVALGWLVL
jgi:uncharacterized membrane protein